MSDNRNIEFDKVVRSMLENATEEVPKHIWGSICDKLDVAAMSEAEAKAKSEAEAHSEWHSESHSSGGKRKRGVIIPVWAKIASGVAAAVAFAVILTLAIDSLDSGHTEMNILSDNTMVPPATEQEIKTTILTDNNTMTGGAVSLSSVPAPETMFEETVDSSFGTTADETADMMTEDARGTTADETSFEAKSEEVTSTTVDETTYESNTYKAETESEFLTTDDDFPDFDEDRPRHKVRTSFVLSGNAISNTNSATGNNKSTTRPSFRPSINDLQQDKVTESSVSSYGIPFSVGIGAKVEFAKRWSVSAGVNYTLLSRTFAGTYYRVDENGKYSDTSFSAIRNRQDYVGIPVNFYFSIVRSRIIDFYAYAGGTAEKCVSNRFTMSSANEHFKHSEKVKGMQFSVNAGIGMEFVIANQFGIYIDPSIRYYFKNENQPNSIRTVQPLMFGVELGFRIRL